MSNMLVLCPNDHARFDYKRLAIARDCVTVLRNKGGKLFKIGKKLKFIEGHDLSPKYVQKQYDMIKSV